MLSEEEKREKKRAYEKSRYARKRERFLLWKQQNPEEAKTRARRHKLMQNYGITIEERDALLTAQGGGCAVCGAREPAQQRDWHVDHCHTSKCVRGILCHHCNTMLGLARDNPSILAQAITYLEKHNGEAALRS